MLVIREITSVIVLIEEDLFLYSCPVITSFVLPRLKFVQEDLIVMANDVLRFLSLPHLLTVSGDNTASGGVQIILNPKLRVISFPALVRMGPDAREEKEEMTSSSPPDDEIALYFRGEQEGVPKFISRPFILANNPSLMRLSLKKLEKITIPVWIQVWAPKQRENEID